MVYTWGTLLKKKLLVPWVAITSFRQSSRLDGRNMFPHSPPVQQNWESLNHVNIHPTVRVQLFKLNIL